MTRLDFSGMLACLLAVVFSALVFLGCEFNNEHTCEIEYVDGKVERIDCWSATHESGRSASSFLVITCADDSGRLMHDRNVNMLYVKRWRMIR